MYILYIICISCVCVCGTVRRVDRMRSVLIWWVHGSSEGMQIMTLRRQVHRLCLAFIQQRENDLNQILTITWITLHSDTEQSFSQYSVKHVTILTEDNRVNH